MDFVFLTLGIACAAGGGELFVRGSVGVATWARIPAGIVGSTIAAFATSSPELSVSIISATDGQPDIALGSSLGSNIANISLVFALAMLFMPMRVSKEELKRDLPFAFLAPIAVGLFGADGQITRLDGLIIISFFLTWLSLTAVQTIRNRSEAPEVFGEKSHTKSLLNGGAGLVLLVLAGFWIVKSAEGIGEMLGWNTFIVGATLVALGTSTPELATTIVSRIKGHDDLGVGTVMGSNIFNALLVVGIAAVIHPIDIKNNWELFYGVLFGVVTLLFVIPGRKNLLGRSRAFALIGLYAVYIFALSSVSVLS